MKNIVNVLIGLLLGLLVAGGLFLTARAPVGQAVVLLPSPTPAPITVYVTGAVQRPGVYRLPRESHLVDLVQAAGGFMEGADLNQVNLAQILKDSDRVDVPGQSPFATPVLTIGDNGLLVTPTPPGGAAVNINTAPLELLEKLPGIGPTTAQAIIDYRKANGPFLTINDLLKIPGIGPSTLENLKGLITVGS
ncbi:MAG: ComEA family DNA-binding protein [Anaerolineales bacterium]